MSRSTSFVVIGILGLVLTVLVIFTVIRSNDLSSRISDLEDSTASLEQASTGGDEPDEIKELVAGLRKLRACIPEIQNQINSLSVEPEYGYIENNSQVSSYCSPIVYPPTQVGE